MNWEKELEEMAKMSQEEIQKRIAELSKNTKPVDENYKKLKASLRTLNETDSDSDY